MYFEKSKNNIYYDRNQLEFICLDQLVPVDHLLRRIENAIDFEFIHRYTKEYYSEDNGRPCLDTIILFKIVLLNFLYGKNSIRATIEDIKVNMAFRWFLGISLTETVPNYSTFSQNYIRRYKGTDVFKKIFTTIITKLLEMNLLDTSVIFVDGTHIKANANKHKVIKKQVKEVYNKFQEDFESEINDYRASIGRDRYDDNNDDDDQNNHGGNITIDEETGEIQESESSNTKLRTISLTDPECGMFVKGEHERQLAYVDQVCCDKNGWILGMDTNAANMHDSKAFLPFFEETILPFKPRVICGDSAYITALISKNVQEHGIDLLGPYFSPKGRRSIFSKKEFKYHLESDTYICPNGNLLHPMNITKDGYIQYQISKFECNGCPNIKECLKSASSKTITRHIYFDCLELAKVMRLSEEGKKIYKLRKETIERKFADGKEHNGLRFTRFRGIEKNKNYRYLLYACMNIKKLALLLSKRETKRNKLSYM